MDTTKYKMECSLDVHGIEKTTFIGLVSLFCFVVVVVCLFLSKKYLASIFLMPAASPL